jgi:hypothetical protein
MDNPEFDAAFDAAMAGLAADGMPERAMTDRDLAVADLNQRYFVSAMKGSVHIVQLEYDDLLGRHHHCFMNKSGFQLLYGNRPIHVGKTQNGHDIAKPLGDLWLADPNRRTYRAMALDPDGRCPPDVYNMWRGFGVEPHAGEWSAIRGHLLDIVCSGRRDYYEWLVRWFAHCVQRPGKPAKTALVLRGEKGAGKSLVGLILTHLFQDHSLSITQARHLTGNFNSHLMDVLALFVDEALWAGDKQGEGVLKALVTQDTLVIEPKGVDSFPMPNRLKIIIASNNDWVIPATKDERRYFALDVPDTRKGDTVYFTKLAAAIKGAELGAFLEHLLGLDLSDFAHRNPPHTEALNEQKLISGSSVEKFWSDCLHHGAVIGCEVGDEDGWPDVVNCTDLHNAFLKYALAHGDRHPPSDKNFGVALRKLCPNGSLKRGRPGTANAEGKRPREYQLDSLEQHRAAFLEAMSIVSYDWPEE